MRKVKVTTIKKIIHHFFLIIGSIIFIFPFYWLISTSLKEEANIFVLPPQLIPNPIQWQNYVDMFLYFPFLRFFINSVYVSTLTILGTLISCSLVAFSFARLKWPGRDIFFVILLSTMMLPFQVTMVPLYLIFRNLGWVDTFKPLWIPAWFGNAFYIFLLRQFFQGIPRELEDAAKVDGASYFCIYSRIILPLSKPALLTVVIFTFMGAWNDFIGPLIYLNSTEKLTLALGLRLFQSQFGGEWALLMAASTVMTLPLVILFFIAQRYFIQGIVLTGLKI